MRNLLLATATLAAAFAGTASAVPIAPGSIISFSDGANYNSTSITFLNNGSSNISNGVAAGSFAAGFGAGCVGCATFTGFTFSPFVGPREIYTATNNGVTTTFSLTTLTTVAVTGSFLDVEGRGTVTLTGFDPTQGTFLLSSQGPQNTNVTFSATTLALAVPEPASMAILGAGLIGIGLVRRKRA